MKTKGEKSVNLQSSPSPHKAGKGPDNRCDDVAKRIAEAAYYKAEARGFEPGFEVDDWLNAERELSTDIELLHKELLQ